MNITREQVASLRRLIEVAVPLVDSDTIRDSEHVADFVDAQLDLEEQATDRLPTEEEIEVTCRAAGIPNPF